MARLSVLESKVDRIERDVSEIKTGIQSLISTQGSVAIALAAREAREEAAEKHRASTAAWVRFISERYMALIAAIVALAALVTNWFYH